MANKKGRVGNTDAFRQNLMYYALMALDSDMIDLLLQEIKYLRVLQSYVRTFADRAKVSLHICRTTLPLNMKVTERVNERHCTYGQFYGDLQANA